MRYLVQALASARNEHSEQFKEPYALAPYDCNTEGDEDSVVQQWKFKGITPIPYSKADRHQQLWQGLEKWADMYSQGITGRRQIVARLGQFPPVSDQNVSAVRDMVWAINDIDVARYFAGQTSEGKIDPGWIATFQEQGLLSLPVGQSEDGQSRSVPLVTNWKLPDYFDLNEVTLQLGRWIAQCLDSKEALDWVLMNGALMHSQFRQEVRHQLEYGGTHIPKALRTIWRLLSDESYANMLSEKYSNPHLLRNSCIKLAPDDKLALWEFLNLLRPIPIIKFNFLSAEKHRNPDRIQERYEIDVELIGIRYEEDIDELRSDANDWEGALVAIVDEITIQLQKTMDWFSMFGPASSTLDITNYEYPSISPHQQNQYAPAWTQLIALARDTCNILVARGESTKADELLQKWKSIPYTVFRRLVLHAVTENPELDIEIGLEFLSDECQTSLWDSKTRRETLRFMRIRGQDFHKLQLDSLTEKILQGPPREMYKNNLTEDDWNERRDHQILLRLYKLKDSGVPLSEKAEETYGRIKRDQQWQPRGDHSEEFPFFSSDFTRYEPSDGGLREDFSEMSNEEFIKWSNSQKERDLRPWEGDRGWPEFAANNIQMAVEHLIGAANKNVWISHLWYPVLHTCRTNENVPSHLNQDIARLLVKMPIPPLDVLVLEAARWLEVVWRQLKKTLRRKLWQKIWEASGVDGLPTQELDFNMTVNHAGGILGNVLYNELTEYYPEIAPAQNPGIPRLLIRRFRCIADSETPSAKLARVRLSPMLFVLYRVDPDWTKRTFFDRMDPTDEVKFDPFLWEGFFWFSNCPNDLLIAIKELLFKILCDLDRIPKRIRNRAARLFTYFAVPPIYGIDTNEAKNVLWKIGPDKLVDVARALNVMLREADERSLTFWNETLKPWFVEVWPTRPVDRSSNLSEALARMAIESGCAFPFVVEVIKDTLTHEKDGSALYQLRKNGKRNTSCK